MKQQARTVNRYDIVLEALERMDERVADLWRKPDESARQAAERLQQQLQVRDVRDTYLITVSLESENPNGLDEIVNSVVKVYLEKAKREEIYAGEDRIEFLSARRKAHVLRIQALTERRGELAQSLGVTTFVEVRSIPTIPS